ncbi:MAG: TRAP transporter large permease subunit, partial [Alphaproteobacteria bacterium]
MMWIMAVMPVVLLVLGFPIFLILLATSAVMVLFVMDIPATQLHITMFGSVDKFALIAVPFFLFAGELMGRGGMSKRIVDWVLAAAGSVRGSLGLTTVGACTMFGALSGSSPATVAALGRLLYNPLRKAGYGERFSNGLLTSSGGIAVVIPPSITMILYGAAAEQS